MNIQSASKASGLSVKTIRYYEQIGLLPEPARLENGYRDYDENSVNILSFIRKSRDLGFSIENCKRLLKLYSNPERASRDVLEIAQSHINEIDKKIAEYKKMKKHLKSLVEQCPGNEVSDCAIIDGLANT